MKKFILIALILILLFNFSNTVFCDTYLQSIDVESNNFDRLYIDCKLGGTIFFSEFNNNIGNWFTGNLLISDRFLITAKGYLYLDGHYIYITGNKYYVSPYRPLDPGENIIYLNFSKGGYLASVKYTFNYIAN
jgi:hypothetical protein